MFRRFRNAWSAFTAIDSGLTPAPPALHEVDEDGAPLSTYWTGSLAEALAQEPPTGWQRCMPARR